MGKGELQPRRKTTFGTRDNCPELTRVKEEATYNRSHHPRSLGLYRFGQKGKIVLRGVILVDIRPKGPRRGELRNGPYRRRTVLLCGETSPSVQRVLWKVVVVVVESL